VLFMPFYFWKKGHNPFKNCPKKLKIWNLYEKTIMNVSKNFYQKIMKNLGVMMMQSQRIFLVVRRERGPRLCGNRDFWLIGGGEEGSRLKPKSAMRINMKEAGGNPRVRDLIL